MDGSTERPRPCKSFGFFTPNLLPWVRYRASQSLLTSPAAAVGLALALQRSQHSGRVQEGMLLAGLWLPYSAQLWQHMLSIQSQKRTWCCPCIHWAASSLLGSEEMGKWNVSGREGKPNWVSTGTAERRRMCMRKAREEECVWERQKKKMR